MCVLLPLVYLSLSIAMCAEMRNSIFIIVFLQLRSNEMYNFVSFIVKISSAIRKHRMKGCGSFRSNAVALHCVDTTISASCASIAAIHERL